MTISDRIRSASSYVAIAVVAGIAAGTVVLSGDGSGTYVEWGTPASATECLISTVHGPSEAYDLLGLVDDGTGYAAVRVCPDATDGGTEEIPDLPPGLTALADSQTVIAYQPGWPTFAAWSPGHPDAPTECACSTGADCTVDDEPAPLGVTVRGAVGEGCRPKPCVELFGVSSWPAECPGGAP